MPETSPRQITTAREYRFMRFASITGSLALGLLALHALSGLLRESIFWYADKSYAEFSAMNHVGHLSLTIGQLATVVIALVGTIAFIATERRRLARQDVRQRRARASEQRRSKRLSGRERLEVFATRSIVYTGLLVGVYFLQLSYEHYLAGFGFGYSDGSLAPLLAIFAAAWIVGALVAAISMYGMRVLSVLEELFERLLDVPSIAVVAVRRYAQEADRTLRKLFGSDQLSRPPPRVLVPVACSLGRPLTRSLLS